MNFRTDLALERHESMSQPRIDGVECERETVDGVEITRIKVVDAKGAEALGKPVGNYVTLEVRPFMHNADLFDGRLGVLSREIAALLPSKGCVLVAGLGNESITPDALGPKVVKLTFATRHIGTELAESIGLCGVRCAAAVVPGVLGKTGIETGEILCGIVQKISPSAVIVIDALASRKLARLGTTVQICDTGISPGSGVGNTRRGINRQLLGVPVIAIGVPTVVDGATLAYDLLEQSGADIDGVDLNADGVFSAQMMVTPKEIDLVIERAAKLIAMGINCALQPQMEPTDILSIVGS